MAWERVILLDTASALRTVAAMGWFASVKAPEALEAFRVCELLDAKMAELHDYLQAAAELLDSDEYARVVREFDEAAAEPRRLRAHFDQTADTNPVSGKPEHEDAYRLVAEQITALLRQLDDLTPPFRRYGQAKAETEYAANRLTNDIAQARGLLSALPQEDRVMWEQRLSVAQVRLREAAERAGERRWLTALDIVEGAAADVSTLISGAKQSVSEHASELSTIGRATDLLVEVRVAGQKSVALLSRASEFLSEEGTKVASGRIAAAGQKLGAAQAHLQRLRTTPASTVDVEKLVGELKEINESIRTLTAELDEVIAQGREPGPANAEQVS